MSDSDFRFSVLKREHTDVEQYLSSINKKINAEVGGRGERPWKGQRKHKRGNESCCKILWTLVLGGLELQREKQRSEETGIWRKRKWSRVSDSTRELWNESKRKGEPSYYRKQGSSLTLYTAMKSTLFCPCRGLSSSIRSQLSPNSHRSFCSTAHRNCLCTLRWTRPSATWQVKKSERRMV